MFGLRFHQESMVRQEEDIDLPGGGSSVDADVFRRYINGTATEDDLIALLGADEITPDQADSYRAKHADDLAPLQQDLAELGLLPIVDPSRARVPMAAAVEYGQNTGEGLTQSGEDLSGVYGAKTPWLVDPSTGLYYDRQGNLAPKYVQDQLSSTVGGGSSDPYAGAREARAARSAAIQEAMNAIDMQRLRQQATLEGAKFAVTPSMTASGGYMPGLEPNSPAVRSGLADPFKYAPTPYNAGFGEDQMAKDLQMIRRIAGVG